LCIKRGLEILLQTGEALLLRHELQQTSRHCGVTVRALKVTLMPGLGRVTRHPDSGSRPGQACLNEIRELIEDNPDKLIAALSD
jgi:hypothetical protein